MAAFATTGDLGLFLGETLAGTRLAKATLMLDVASAQIRAWTRQYIERVVDQAVTMRGTADWEIVLPERPVVSVAAVTIDGTAIASSSYHLAGDTLVRPAGWNGPASIVALTYTHGYSPIPDDIKGVCLQIAARLMTVPAGGAVTQEAIGTYSVTYGSGGAGGDEDPLCYLNRYRRRTGAPRIDPERQSRRYPIGNL